MVYIMVAGKMLTLNLQNAIGDFMVYVSLLYIKPILGMFVLTT